MISGIVGEMAKPLSWGMPVDKVCEKLKKKDRQVKLLASGQLTCLPSFIFMRIFGSNGSFVTKLD